MGGIGMPDLLASDANDDVIFDQPWLATGYEGVHLPVAVLLDNIRSMYNVGAFFRTADGVSLEKLCLCGVTAHPPKKAITKTALSSEQVVAWEHDGDALQMAKRMRDRGFEIAAVETGMHSIDLFEWQPRFPVCVAFGNEVEGVQPALLEIAGIRVRIPMLGQKTSLNVATAAGVVLYELLRKYRILSMNAPDLGPGILRHRDFSASASSI
jgi:tRNA G18 (ribose-2'-O)-methylase SpoU